MLYDLLCFFYRQHTENTHAFPAPEGCQSFSCCSGDSDTVFPYSKELRYRASHLICFRGNLRALSFYRYGEMNRLKSGFRQVLHGDFQIFAGICYARAAHGIRPRAEYVAAGDT